MIGSRCSEVIVCEAVVTVVTTVDVVSNAAVVTTVDVVSSAAVVISVDVVITGDVVIDVISVVVITKGDF